MMTASVRKCRNDLQLGVSDRECVKAKKAEAVECNSYRCYRVLLLVSRLMECNR